jgi:hypothetical protein
VIHAEPVVIPDDLVRAARQGSQAARSDLWNLCEPIVRGEIVRSRGRNIAETAEAVQEAALVLFGILQDREQESDDDTEFSAPSFAQRFQRRVQTRIRTYLRAERRRPLAPYRRRFRAWKSHLLAGFPGFLRLRQGARLIVHWSDCPHDSARSWPVFTSKTRTSGRSPVS